MSTTHCEEIGGELVAFLDGELDEEARRPVATHVATCLVCRREVERLTVVRRWVTELPAIEPSPGLAEGLWERLAAEEPAPSPRVRALRPWRWAVPALAAAAVIALAFSSQLRPHATAPATPPASAPAERVAAPAAPARKVDAPAVAAARPAPKADEPQVAAAEAVRPEDLRLEDLPPELAEHPELFLRLPVVRRLETLEHIDAVQNSHGDDEGGAG